MAVNTTNAREKAIAIALDEIGSGKPLSESSRRLFTDVFRRSDKILNDDGSVKAAANVSGRTEPLQATLTNITSVGNLTSLAKVNNTNTDLLTDGTGSPLTGGKRGFNALDTNNRLAGSSKNNALNVSSFFTGGNPLTQSGTSTLILVAGSSRQFGDGVRSYNSGSVDPGVLGGWTVIGSDPTFAGGTIPYQATQTNNAISSADGNLNFGSITTAGGGGGSGAGGGSGEFPPRYI